MNEREWQLAMKDNEMNVAGASNKRRLLDTYGDSLRHVNKLYNRRFGVETRHVPAHMPHAIDKYILIELIHELEKEFERSSSHRFRSALDMQWSFSYYYYMMSATKKSNLDIDYIYSEELDLDGDGYLNDYEEMRLVDEILIKNVEDANANLTLWKDFFHRALWNITHQLHDLTYWHPLDITIFSVNYTEVIREYLLKHFGKRKKFKFKKEALDEVEFYMIKDDWEAVEKRLKGIYEKKPKFMCLNDDMPHDKDPSNETMHLLHSFLYQYFPYPSPFELRDPKQRNLYLHVQEYKEKGLWKKQWDLNTKEPFDDKKEHQKAATLNQYKSKRKKLRKSGLLNAEYYYLGRDKDKNKNIESNNIPGNVYRENANAIIQTNKNKEQFRNIFYRLFVRFSRRIGWLWSVLLMSFIVSVVLFVLLSIIDQCYHCIWSYAFMSTVSDNESGGASFQSRLKRKLQQCCQYVSLSYWKKHWLQRNRRDD
ncbi:N-acetylglucosamine-1-phosphate transferase [Reticulomyxa filosa]|uniref:N-acetylglucosamine-1-phosphate transferase n=1 Tax=Reticulomyxa filosa TaxID=46433 RepID=X6MED4_RETFI|nr:N-acetylglucosamine-1-phosphate transferase [Reticulomyxa filosa]|eukprot:ETO11375.1 N-acetylglucosamine-1-phosphate transferase [Reticulomyxa filosa]